MIKYRYLSDGTPYVKEVFDQCSRDDCTICKAIRQYFEWEGRSKFIDNLANGNLKRHLASGRHWKSVGVIDCKTNEYHSYI